MSHAVVMTGVAGKPINHSLSPVLHEAAFRALGLAWSSERFEAGVGQGSALLSIVKQRGLRGVSVTMPLKEELLDLVDWVDASAWRLQSINCVLVEDDQTTGYSTDGEGFVTWLGAEGVLSIDDRHCIVIGAGGAARAVAAALGDAGAATVGILARDTLKAGNAAGLVGPQGYVASRDDLARADLVVNATPQGMAGTVHEASEPCDVALLRPDAMAVDLVYEPLETPWMAALGRRGITTHGGLGMLVYQAAIQVELWTGAQAPIPEMLRAAHQSILERP